MDKPGMDIFRKNFWLISVGIILQMISGIFLFAGTIRTLLDLKEHVRKILIENLTEK